MKYDVVIIGAGPGGIFSAYELMKQNNDLKIALAVPVLSLTANTISQMISAEHFMNILERKTLLT